MGRKVSAKVEGLSNLDRKVDGYVGAKLSQIQQLIAKGAVEIQNEGRSSVQKGPASGRTYEKYNPRRTHTASSPGQAPATDTGRLAQSINAKISPDKLSATIGVHKDSAVEYAVYLEFGTRRIKRRPFMRPAFRKTLPKVRRALRRLR